MSDTDPKLLTLTTLLQLQQAARRADSRERLGFVVCNETHRLVRYRQAILWSGQPPRLHTISGLAHIEKDAPFSQWMSRLLPTLLSLGGHSNKVVGSADVPQALQKDWQKHLPAQVLYCPFVQCSQVQAGLLLIRDEPWQEAELALLDMLSDAYQHAWFAQTVRHPPLHRGVVRQWLPWGVVLAMFALAWLPVNMSVLAPAEVVADSPAVVAAPQDGVVKQVLIRPNQQVQPGDLLFELDDTRARNALEVARKSLAVAQAQYSRARQQAFTDTRSKGEVRELQARRDEAQAELAYNQDLLQRSRVLAERAGIAVFSNPDEWTGKPVTTGEKVMTIADPAATELQVWLPVADAFISQPGAQVLFFRDTNPRQPLQAHVQRTSYAAETRPDGLLAFRLRATFVTENTARLGVHGTAKVQGEQVTLFYYLMRRPLAVLRQWLGW